LTKRRIIRHPNRSGDLSHGCKFSYSPPGKGGQHKKNTGL
jgi:hypothetical protein